MHRTKWKQWRQKEAGYGTLQSQQSMQRGDGKLQTAATDFSELIASVSDRQWGTESVTALFLNHARIFQNLSVLVLFLDTLHLDHGSSPCMNTRDRELVSVLEERFSVNKCFQCGTCHMASSFLPLPRTPTSTICSLSRLLITTLTQRLALSIPFSDFCASTKSTR